MKEEILSICWFYAWVWRTFTVFGPLLMEPHLHKPGTIDSWNQCMNCISNKMYHVCVLFLWIQQMNGSRDTAFLLLETLQYWCGQIDQCINKLERWIRNFFVLVSFCRKQSCRCNEARTCLYNRAYDIRR